MLNFLGTQPPKAKVDEESSFLQVEARERNEPSVDGGKSLLERHFETTGFEV